MGRGNGKGGVNRPNMFKAMAGDKIVDVHESEDVQYMRKLGEIATVIYVVSTFLIFLIMIIAMAAVREDVVHKVENPTYADWQALEARENDGEFAIPLTCACRRVNIPYAGTRTATGRNEATISVTPTVELNPVCTNVANVKKDCSDEALGALWNNPGLPARNASCEFAKSWIKGINTLCGMAAVNIENAKIAAMSSRLITPSLINALELQQRVGTAFSNQKALATQMFTQPLQTLSVVSDMERPVTSKLLGYEHAAPWDEHPPSAGDEPNVDGKAWGNTPIKALAGGVAREMHEAASNTKECDCFTDYECHIQTEIITAKRSPSGKSVTYETHCSDLRTMRSVPMELFKSNNWHAFQGFIADSNSLADPPAESTQEGYVAPATRRRRRVSEAADEKPTTEVEAAPTSSSNLPVAAVKLQEHVAAYLKAGGEARRLQYSIDVNPPPPTYESTMADIEAAIQGFFSESPFNVYSESSSFDADACASAGCTVDMLNNGICDSECDNPQCQWDTAQCRCSSGCDYSSNYFGDGFCDAVCNNVFCFWDSPDCNTQNCDNGVICYDEILSGGGGGGGPGDGGGDPGAGGGDDPCSDPYAECASGCTCMSVGNGICNAACNVEACYFDGYDCGFPDGGGGGGGGSGECAPGCPDIWIGDGYCDAACASSEACRNDCNEDGTQCDCGSGGGGSAAGPTGSYGTGSYGTGSYGTGNYGGPSGMQGGYSPYYGPQGSEFSQACLDEGCLQQWRGDGFCDEKCNNPQCDYDCGAQPGSFFNCDCQGPGFYGPGGSGSGAGPVFDPYAALQTASTASTGQTLGPLKNAMDQGLINVFGAETNHEKYFNACNASTCVYAVNEGKDSTTIASQVFGLLGGLSVVMKVVATVTAQVYGKLRGAAIREQIKKERSEVTANPLPAAGGAAAGSGAMAGAGAASAAPVRGPKLMLKVKSGHFVKTGKDRAITFQWAGVNQMSAPTGDDNDNQDPRFGPGGTGADFVLPGDATAFKGAKVFIYIKSNNGTGDVCWDGTLDLEQFVAGGPRDVVVPHSKGNGATLTVWGQYRPA